MTNAGPVAELDKLKVPQCHQFSHARARAVSLVLRIVQRYGGLAGSARTT